MCRYSMVSQPKQARGGFGAEVPPPQSSFLDFTRQYAKDFNKVWS